MRLTHTFCHLENFGNIFIIATFGLFRLLILLLLLLLLFILYIVQIRNKKQTYAHATATSNLFLILFRTFFF